MKLHVLRAMVALGGLAVSIPSFADGIKAQPGVFDPGKTKTVSAAWVAKEGLPDSGKSDHALILIKATDTTTNAAAGADITGAEGDPADTLGYDIRDDSVLGSAPRFNLLASDGFHFVGGQNNGVPTPLVDARGRTWRRYVFNCHDPAQAFPPVAPGATIVSLSVIQDEDTRPSPSGAVILDNINVNGTYIGKPGNAK